MNTTLHTHKPTTHEASHTPLDRAASPEEPTLRTALPDRIAMRIGMALLVWSSRRAPRVTPEEALRIRRNEHERRERENQMLMQRHFYGGRT